MHPEEFEKLKELERLNEEEKEVMSKIATDKIDKKGKRSKITLVRNKVKTEV
jgi:hypothetical protein